MSDVCITLYLLPQIITALNK